MMVVADGIFNEKHLGSHPIKVALRFWLIENGLEVTNGKQNRNFGCTVPSIPLGLQGSTPLEPFLYPNAEGGPLNTATMQPESTARSAVALDLTVQCARVAEDNKARDIVIL